MSSPNPATSETTTLLGDSRPTGQLGKCLLRERFRFSQETLLIPVAVATRLATQIPSTTLIELIRRAVCRLWNISHADPFTLPGSASSELCDAPEIARYFATVIAILGVIESIISIVWCGVLSRISSQYGRKPAFLLVLITGIIGSCMISVAQYMPHWLTDWVFLVGMLFNLGSGTLPYTYLVNMYCVDVCVPEDRTAALSRITGWATLGTCISFALGGSITTKTGNSAIVFYTAAALYIVTFIYVSSFLPESFPEEKRNALSRMRVEPSTDGHSTTTRFSALHVFEPLKTLIPTCRLDGTRNWRLIWCAAHTFVFMAANTYAPIGWLVLVTSKYHLTPADTGIFLTIVSVSGAIVLTLIVPPLVSFLRPYYRREIMRPLLVEDIANGEELKLETSDRLDVHVAFVSCVITAVFYLSAALSTTIRALILSAIFIGLGSAHMPTVRSLVVGSVDPLNQGEALAALEMVTNAGCLLSPIVMGSILTATIETTPLLLFYVHLVVVLVSSVLLFLVRDEDRYQKPREA